MDILSTLNEHYPISFNRLESVRDMGSAAYIAFSRERKYFLRVIKPAFFDTAVTGADIQVFLQNQGFPVPPVVFTCDDSQYIKTECNLLILYEYIDGNESNPEQDAEAIGNLVGRLHRIMKSYSGELIKRDKHFFIGRYVDILRKRKYARAEEFHLYGEDLWNKIKDLPRGFCHGDMYSGNIHKAPDGKLFLLDFDTSCCGFPMYDPALICDMTKYFEYDTHNFEKSNRVLSRFLPEYLKYNSLTQAEINAFHDLIAIQHFATQATVMELFGHDCLSDTDLDNQLDWLCRWREQCDKTAK